MSAIEEIRNAVRKLEKVAFGGGATSYRPEMQRQEILSEDGMVRPYAAGTLVEDANGNRATLEGLHRSADWDGLRNEFIRVNGYDPVKRRIREGVAFGIPAMGMSLALGTPLLPASMLIGGTSAVGKTIETGNPLKGAVSGAVDGGLTFAGGKVLGMIPGGIDRLASSRVVSKVPWLSSLLSTSAPIAAPAAIAVAEGAHANNERKGRDQAESDRNEMIRRLLEGYTSPASDKYMDPAYRRGLESFRSGGHLSEDQIKAISSAVENDSYMGSLVKRYTDPKSKEYMDNGIGMKLDAAMDSGRLTDARIRSIQGARTPYLNQMAQRMSYKVPYTKETAEGMVDHFRHPSRWGVLSDANVDYVDRASREFNAQYGNPYKTGKPRWIDFSMKNMGYYPSPLN